jgi:hypothetical protein
MVRERHEWKERVNFGGKDYEIHCSYTTNDNNTITTHFVCLYNTEAKFYVDVRFIISNNVQMSYDRTYDLDIGIEKIDSGLAPISIFVFKNKIKNNNFEGMRYILENPLDIKTQIIQQFNNPKFKNELQMLKRNHNIYSLSLELLKFSYEKTSFTQKCLNM